jgi:hypothetical protein
MSDDTPWYAPNHVPKVIDRRRPREALFAFQRDADRFVCELVDHGPYGIEAQFFQNEDFLISRRFETRALAITWASLEREALLRGTI